MQAWIDIEVARARCEAFRAEAARNRLARGSRRASRGGARRRLARTLLALGSLFVDAGHRLDGNVAIDC